MDDLRDDPDDPDLDSAWWAKFAAGIAAALVIDGATIGLAWTAPVVVAMVAPASDIAGMAMIVAYVWTVLFGVLQVVYVGPIAGLLWVSNQKGLAAGFAAGAGVAFLASGLLYGCVGSGIGGIAAYCSTVSWNIG